ncbi:hypothetical protein Trydic_g15081 [Trypoxylus dichotomus]
MLHKTQISGGSTDAVRAFWKSYNMDVIENTKSAWNEVRNATLSAVWKNIWIEWYQSSTTSTLFPTSETQTDTQEEILQLGRSLDADFAELDIQDIDNAHNAELSIEELCSKYEDTSVITQDLSITIKWNTMGNIGSQISNSSHKYKLESTSDIQRLSLPRIGHNQQQKVLPISKEPRPKLRSTENGKILNSGGTLSGRQHQESRVPRGNFMNVKEKVNLLKELQEHDNGKGFPLRPNRDLKKSGSEPDLRIRLRQERYNNVAQRRYDDCMARVIGVEKQSSQDANNCNTRRIGLFKTRIESNNRKNIPRENKCVLEEKIQDVKHQSLVDLQPDSPIIVERLQTNECKDVDPNRSKRCSNVEDVKHVISDEINEENHVKKYYFGMESNTSHINQLHYTIQDDISSDIFANQEVGDGVDASQKIKLNLRPILPKKQLEIPRFSSSLAWKLLYSVDSDSNLDRSSLNNTDDDQVLVEERIAPLSPSRLSKSLDFQFSQDKSGDSGISGDETPKPATTWNHYYKNKQSWTPQQDLGDDDSTTDEDDVEGKRFNSIPCYSNTTNVNKPHIFSLSLPRDHFTNQCTLEKYKNNLKRSSSGLLSNNNELDSNENHCAIKNSNWLLSKSAPNSLNNGFASLDSGHCVYNGPISSMGALQSNGQHGKGRIMYLPQGNCGNHGSNNGLWLNNQKRSKNEMSNGLSENLLQEAQKREQERLREIEAMQRIEEEFRRKRARYNGLYVNNQQDFRKVLIITGEKSV